MNTIQDYAHAARKELDANAFATVMQTFTKCEDFWNQPATDVDKALIEALSSGINIANNIKKQYVSDKFFAIDRDCANYVRHLMCVNTDISEALRNQKTYARVRDALSQYVRIVMNLNFIAYMTMYFEITFENGTVIYVQQNCDFSKPPTERLMFKFMDQIKAAAENAYTGPVVKIRFITQEEYGANTGEWAESDEGDD